MLQHICNHFMQCKSYVSTEIEQPERQSSDTCRHLRYGTCKLLCDC